MDDMPDMPLENFGGSTEVATPPVAEEPTVVEPEQTTQPTEGSGSEEQDNQQNENPKAEPEAPGNSKPEEQTSQRPEKRDRLQSRFGELTGKIKEKDSYIEQLEAQIAQQQAQAGVTPLKPNENGEYDVEALQQYQAQVAQSTARAEVQLLRSQIEREQVASRMDSEGSQIEKTLAEKGLDNPVHTENILAEIEEKIALAQYNPQALKQISPKKIADRYIKGIEAERRKAQSTTAQNVQNLQAEQAVPTNAPAPVDDEAALEARIANIKF